MIYKSKHLNHIEYHNICPLLTGIESSEVNIYSWHPVVLPGHLHVSSLAPHLGVVLPHHDGGPDTPVSPTLHLTQLYSVTDLKVSTRQYDICLCLSCLPISNIARSQQAGQKQMLYWNSLVLLNLTRCTWVWSMQSEHPVLSISSDSNLLVF